MIIRFEIQEINYERCFENLIPQMVEESKSRATLSEVEKLLVKLGPDAIPVMKKLLWYFDTDARDQSFIWLLEEQQDMFVEAANTHLDEMLGEKTIEIGGLYGHDLPGPMLALYATQVNIDYKKLIKSPVFGNHILEGAAKLAYQVSKPAAFEKQGIKLLSSSKVKPLFISVLTDSLHQAGLVLTLSDVELMDDAKITLPSRMKDPAKDEGLLPDAIEDHILDAIAAWLKDSL